MAKKPSVKSPKAVTDAAILKAVRAAFRADPAFDGQRTHMAVHNKKRVVTLTGFVTKKALKKKAGDTVSAIKGVKKVNNNLFLHAVAGCGPGQRACCGGCIDANAPCNCLE